MTDYFKEGLSRASFEGVTFPAGECRDESGHTLIEHVAHGRRGADLEHTQRKADRGEIDIPLFNDDALARRFGKPMVPDLHVELVAKFASAPIGDLFHPALGSFRAGIESWSKVLDPARRNGWTLKLKWIEHNAEASDFLGDARAASADPASAASTTAADADTAMALSDPTGDLGWTPLGTVVDTQLAYLDTDGLTPAEMDAGFRVMLTPLGANILLFGDATDYATVATLEALRAVIYELRAARLPTTGTRSYTPVVPVSAWEAAVAAYGDGTRAALILAANASITDPLRIEPGTVLVIPPAT